MTADEFISYRNIKVKDNEHRRVIELFYPYLRSVSDDERLLPTFLEKHLNMDLLGALVVTACFNGVNDGSIPPCDNVDLYIKLSNGVKVFVYGRETKNSNPLNPDEYVMNIKASL